MSLVMALDHLPFVTLKKLSLKSLGLHHETLFNAIYISRIALDIKDSSLLLQTLLPLSMTEVPVPVPAAGITISASPADAAAGLP
ncbi:hypothetical protein MY10362_007572 [Beauveria mimosiformis]